MTARGLRRSRWAWGGALIAAAALTGCGASGAPGAASGPGMMGGQGYSYSRTSCTAPVPPAGASVQVTLADAGMSEMMGGDARSTARMMLSGVPGTLSAGQVTFVASNRGWRTHELVILPLSPGAVDGQRVPDAEGRVNESGSLGEASGDCASGAGDGIRAGGAGWVTVTLRPGRYELVCNLVNHYAAGMHEQLTVT